MTKVGNRTAAQEAGIKAGNVLLSLNGTPLENREQFRALLKEMAPGDEVTLEVDKNGNKETLTIELGER